MLFVFLCSGLTKVYNFGIPTLTNKSCVMQSKNVRLAMFLLTVSCIIDEKSCDVNDARFLKYVWPFFITGKTHVLSHIKYHILQRKLIQKELILLITFPDHKNILTWKKQTPATTSTIISDQILMWYFRTLFNWILTNWFYLFLPLRHFLNLFF